MSAGIGRLLTLGAAICAVAGLAGTAAAQSRLNQLYAVTLETTSAENVMQIACGPDVVRSSAVIELQIGSSVVKLRQEDVSECHGLWAPLWAAQPMVLHWVLGSPVYFDPGLGSISFWDADWINGPRRKLVSHFNLSVAYREREKASKLIPEGYILTLHYGKAGLAGSYRGAPRRGPD